MNYIEIQNKLIEDYRIIHNPISTCWRRTHAHVDGSRRICKHHITNSYKSLFTLCHEIGHIETNKKGMKRCQQESEATLWAIKKLQEIGISIKRKVVMKYKEYVRNTYERGMRRRLMLSGKQKSQLFM